MKKGDTVTQIVKPITGEVVSKVFDEDQDEFQYLVEHKAGDETKQTWFTESQLEGGA